MNTTTPISSYSRFPTNNSQTTLKTFNPLSSASLKPTNYHLNNSSRSFLHNKKLVHRCNSSTTPPGENESKEILDAFFLGKAFAEALNERIESTVGEFLSTVGRLQAEQQKQVQEFQDEVLERAKKAKEKAAREAQGLVPKSTASNTSSPVTEPINASAAADEPTVFTSESSSGSKDESPNNGSTDPLLGISIDD